MKYTIITFLFFVNNSFTQNRYTDLTTSSYSPMTYREIMLVPQILNEKNNENLDYLYSLKNWILELNNVIKIESFNKRLDNELKDLTIIEDQDLSRAKLYLKETEFSIKQIIRDYNNYISKENEKLSSKKTVENSLEIAMKYYNNKEYAKSISNFSKYLENDKNNTDVLFYRALAKTEINDIQGSINDYEKIISLNSNYPLIKHKISIAYNNNAILLTKLKKYKEALILVNKALEMEKSDSFIWETRAEINYELSSYNKSLLDYNKAIELNENSNLYFSRAKVYNKLGLNDKYLKDIEKSAILGNNIAKDIIIEIESKNTKKRDVFKDIKNFIYETTFDNVMEEVPLRSEPSILSNEIYNCPKDAIIKVLEYSNDSYYKVYVDGFTGYISKGFLKQQ